MKKIVALITALCTVCMMVVTFYSHTPTTGSIWWGEQAGWRPIQNSGAPLEWHLASNSFTYQIVPSTFMTTNMELNILAGALAWFGTVNISQGNTGVTGQIRFVNNMSPIEGARVRATSVSGGHAVGYEMELNTAHANILQSHSIAHEFGHVIGLYELGMNANRSATLPDYTYNKTNLMYGTELRAVTAPTVRDRAGARIIMGQTCNHNFISSFIYEKRLENGKMKNRQREACTGCFGFRVSTQTITCTSYNSNGRCNTVSGSISGCNTPRNGDVNQNGKIDMPDAVEIQCYLAKLGNMVDDTMQSFYLADSNGDGNVVMQDALEILNYLAQLPSIIG